MAAVRWARLLARSAARSLGAMARSKRAARAASRHRVCACAARRPEGAGRILQAMKAKRSRHL
eukprot:2002729-Lingulodinium_polyedra.AAC.1